MAVKKKRASSVSAPKLSASMRRCVEGIPGYDPVATAGPCHFDADAAQDAMDFFPECLKHVKGAKGGEPFVLEPWQQAIVANLYGWKRPDGTRRYRECFIFVPRKNGKTPLVSGIVLYSLFCDPEPGAEIYSAAADRDQASLVFAHAKGMVLQEVELSSRCKIYEVARAIVREDTQSSYKVISAEANTKHGYNSNLVVIDELHAQPNRELVDVLTTSTGARRQPLILYTTTSDFERPSICNEKWDYATKVRDGVLQDDAFLPVIYEAPKLWDGHPADYLSLRYYADEAIWQHANPNLGVSLSWEYMRAECRRAQETPAYLNTFLRLHLNVRTQQDVAHYDITQWDACAAPIDPEDLRGRPCWGGLDLASTSDLCALALIFPEDDNTILAYFWLPEATALIRERRSRVPYPAWVNQGYITTTPGNVADYDVVYEDILSLMALYDLQDLAYDRWGATHLMTRLQGAGLTCTGFGQGFASMSAPMKELDRLLASGELRHGGNPVARWCLSNVMSEGDAAGNVKPSKKKSSEKIDFCTAVLMALGRAMVRDQAGPSVYERRGVLMV